MSAVSSSLTFIIQTLGQLYIYAVLMRFLLQLSQADFYNPLSQAVVKITAFLVNPLRKIIPNYKTLDFAVLALAILLETALLYTLYSLKGVSITQLPFLLVLIQSLFKLFDQLLNIYIFSMVIIAIASWVTSGQYNAMVSLLIQLTAPIADRVRQVIPSIGGLDFSFMAILIIIMLIQGVLPNFETYILQSIYGLK